MNESAEAPVTAEAPRKGWLVESIERTAEHQKRLGEIQVRNARIEARRENIGKNVSTVLFILVALTCTFGLAMGALAMWNAVVG